MRCFIECVPRRLYCPGCGDVYELAPWARAGSPYTRDFEHMTAFLAQRTNQTAISRLMRIAWWTVGKILERVVADAYSQAISGDNHAITAARPRAHPARAVRRCRRTENDGVSTAAVGSVYRMPTKLARLGDGVQRKDVAHVEQTELEFVASGTQLSLVYKLRYQLNDEALHLELVGERTVEIGLDGADFFDLGWSPLVNSFP